MSRSKAPAVRDCRPCTACCDGWVCITVAGQAARWNADGTSWW
ncbi:hypothetical protein [Candidatus Thiodictyon syntrophicum]|nr:hypothetical protein [Candidatus Thiodictyon syntrophicum]